MMRIYLLHAIIYLIPFDYFLYGNVKGTHATDPVTTQKQQVSYC
jgi:hypothetical protein